MAATGISNAMIARNLGIDLATLKRHRKKDAEFAEAIERGKARGVRRIAKIGYDLATLQKDPGMIRFLLATVGGFKERAQVEHTGKDGGPIQTENKGTTTVVSSETMTRLKAYEEALRDAERLDMAAGAAGGDGFR